jgi:hypothetical protein
VAQLIRLKKIVGGDGNILDVHKAIGFAFGALEQRFSKSLWQIRRFTMEWKDSSTFEIEAIVSLNVPDDRTQEWCELEKSVPYPLSGYHYYSSDSFWITWDNVEIVSDPEEIELVIKKELKARGNG